MAAVLCGHDCRASGCGANSPLLPEAPLAPRRPFVMFPAICPDAWLFWRVTYVSLPMTLTTAPAFEGPEVRHWEICSDLQGKCTHGWEEMGQVQVGV